MALALAILGDAALVDMSHGWDDLNRTTSTSAGASLVDLARIGPALAGALHTALVPVGDGTAQVLAAPPDPSALELVCAGLGDALVRELRESVAVGVVDLGRLTAGVARETIAGADRILVVVTPDERAALSARAVPASILGGTMLLDGPTNARDLETQYNLPLPRDEGFETLAGTVLASFGSVHPPN